MKSLDIICDNRTIRRDMIPSWGLSIGLLDPTGWTLFDVGNDPNVFLHNFKTLGGNLKEVKRIILSHLHFDHIGGLRVFENLKIPIDLYLPEPLPPDAIHALEAHSFQTVIVPPEGLKQGNLWLLPIPGNPPPEQLLIIDIGEEILLLTGCAHFGIEKGLLAVWERFHRPFGLVCGGFHLAFRSILELEEVLQVFQILPIRSIAPCHCTGDQAIETFASHFPETFRRVGAGWHLSI